MARYIPDDVLETIRLRADIVEIVQSYVPTLKKAGGTWKACCPFHQEKTPSFTVNPARGIYKCFGCGKGGNVFSFVMEMERLDFPNAAELLARRYSIVIPDTRPVFRKRASGSAEPAASPESSYDVRERLYLLHEKLAAWYVRQLQENPESPVAVYFRTRGIPSDAAFRFGIGAAPDSWDAAIRFLHDEGFRDDELRLSGVVSSKEENSSHLYDRFRNRLMFPIWNEQGRVVAFSARSIEKDPGGWKYVNSPETPVFKKSRTLYALHFARHGIHDKNGAVLCEGQLDVIAMHRAGCTHAVAPQGTAFGEEQARILARYTRNICLALDNDKAGREAVMKDAAILLPMGFSLKVAVFPGAKDADELLKSAGPEVLRKTVEDASDFFDFLLNVSSEGLDLASPAGKAAAAGRVAAYLHLIDNPVTLDIYADWLAGKLGISRDTVLAETERFHRMEAEKAALAARYAARAAEGRTPDAAASAGKNKAAQPLSFRHPGMRKAMLELLELLLVSERHAGRAAADVSSDMLDASAAGQALEIVISSAMNGEWEEAPGRIMMMMTKNDFRDDELSALLMPQSEVPAEPPDAERRYSGAVRALTCISLSERRSALIAEAMALPDGDEKKTAILQDVTALNRKLFSLRS